MPNSARITIVLLLLAAVAMLASSCGGNSALKNVRGLLTDLQGRSITQVATLTLQEQGTGKTWTFQAEGDIGFTPSHLRVHMLQGAPVTVHYKERDGTLVAVLVAD